MLQDDDTRKVAFAACCLALSKDMDVVSSLRACIERHKGNPEVVSAACGSLYAVLGGDSVWLPRVLGPDADRNESLKWFQWVCRWLDSREAEWRGKTNAQYWWPRLETVVKQLETEDTPETETLCLAGLTYSWFVDDSDGETAARPIFEYIASFREWENHRARSHLRSFMNTVQLYIGPVDVPRENDLPGLRKCSKELVAWWKEQEAKKPIFWYLDRLARRGYATDNPSDVKQTAEAILSVLQKGTPPERYAARAALAHGLPDGDGIPVLSFVDSVVRPELPVDRDPIIRYLDTIVRLRAQQWASWDSYGHVWDAEAGKYVPRARAAELDANRTVGAPKGKLELYFVADSEFSPKGRGRRPFSPAP